MNGKPIKIENLPSPGFPAPTLLDHTQYRSVFLKHEAEDKQFDGALEDLLARRQDPFSLSERILVAVKG